MKFEEGIDRSNSNKDTAEQKEAYSSPNIISYGDIRDITLGSSVHSGESGPYRSETIDVFEGSLFEERGSIGGSGSGSGDSGGRTGRN